MSSLRQRILSFYAAHPYETISPSAEQLQVDAIPYTLYTIAARQCAQAAYNHDVTSYNLLLQEISTCGHALQICPSQHGILRLGANLTMQCMACESAQRYIDLALCGRTKEQTFLAMQYDIDMRYHDNQRAYLMMHASSKPTAMNEKEIQNLMHTMKCDRAHIAMPSVFAAVKRIHSYQLFISEKNIARLERDARIQSRPASTSIRTVSGGLCTPK